MHCIRMHPVLKTFARRSSRSWWMMVQDHVVLEMVEIQMTMKAVTKDLTMRLKWSM